MKTTRIVIDASVALKWLLDEPYSPEAAELLDRRQDYRFLAPDLISVEVANGLWKHVKKGELGLEQAKALHEGLFAEDVFTLYPAADYMDKAFDITHQIQHNGIYDCIYLALAEAFDCSMITADQKLIQRASTGGIPKRVSFIANLH